MRPNDDLIVSSVEPTGLNRKKVWMQKGKNLFDYASATYLLAYCNATTLVITTSTSTNNHRTSYIKCKPNTTYTIKKQVGKSFRVSTTTNTPSEGVSINQTQVNHTTTEQTITTGENDNYLVFTCFSTENGDTGNYLDMYKTVVIEEGTEIIQPKTYVKNGNNVYEEFANGVVSGSNSNGDYIKFADGTMICRHRQLFSEVEINISGNTMPYTSASLSFDNFPAEFASVPSVNISIDGSVSGVIINNSPSTTVKPYSFNVGRYNSLGERDFFASYIAIGRWK